MVECTGGGYFQMMREGGASDGGMTSERGRDRSGNV